MKLVSHLLLFFSCAAHTGAFGNNILTLSDAPIYDFGSVVPPGSANKTFTLSNTGYAIAFNISGAVLSGVFSYEGGGAFPGATGTCGTTLNPGQSCTIVVTFTPSDSSPANATLTVNYNYATYPGTAVSVTRNLEGNQNACSLIPVLTQFSPRIVNVSTTRTITLTGQYFTPATTISVTGLATSAVSYVSSTQMTFDVTTTAATGFYDVVVTNECGSVTSTNAIESRVVAWVDLRLGGDSDASLGTTTNAAITPVRDASGMYFTGTGGWGNWVQFRSHTFTRGAASAFEIVYTQLSATSFMCGIGSDNQNFASASQWSEIEIGAFPLNNSLWGYYGNNGTPGNFWNLSIGSVATTYNLIYKVRFENDGATGNNLILYQVNPIDWDLIQLTLDTTASTNVADESNLEPTCVPNTVGNQWRVIGFKIE